MTVQWTFKIFNFPLFQTAMEEGSDTSDQENEPPNSTPPASNLPASPKDSPEPPPKKKAKLGTGRSKKKASAKSWKSDCLVSSGKILKKTYQFWLEIFRKSEAQFWVEILKRERSELDGQI